MRKYVAVMLAISSAFAQTIPVQSVLDDAGHIQTAGYQGTLDTTGYQLIAEPGTTPRFAKASLPGQWQALGASRGGGCNGFIGAAVEMPNNDVIVGGSFTRCGSVAVNNIARWDGQTWQALGAGIEDQTSPIQAMKVIGTDLFVGGAFTSAGGVPVSNIARWDGTAWHALGSGVDDLVRAIDEQAGALIVVGAFFSAGNQPANLIAKWSNGVWSSFTAGAQVGLQGTARSVKVDGTNIYVGGTLLTSTASPSVGVMRWNGTAWNALGGIGANFNGTVTSLDIASNLLYAGGDFTTTGGVAANRIAKFDGSNWSAVGSVTNNGTNSQVTAIKAIGTDVFVAGNFTSAAGQIAHGVAKWDGTNWTGVSLQPNTIGVQSLSNIGTDLLATGSFRHIDGVAATAIARLTGTTWNPIGGSSSGQGFNGRVNVVAVDGTNLYVGGQFSQVGGIGANNIARWDGTTWRSLSNPLGNGVLNLNSFTQAEVASIAVNATDVYVGGTFNTVGGALSIGNIARWNKTTGWWRMAQGISQTFPNFGPATVKSIALDGINVYVCGNFNDASGQTVFNIARWNGSTWSAVGAAISIPNMYLQWLAFSQNQLYVAGIFPSIGGVTANSIARWNGSTWNALGTVENTQNLWVRALSFDGNVLYANRRYLDASNTDKNAIARWNGASWDMLADLPLPSAGFYINTLLVNNGTAYVGGNFTDVLGVAANRIAALNLASGTWSSLGERADNGLNDEVLSIAKTGGDILVGGQFTEAAQQPSVGMARWAGASADIVFSNGFEN
jgi:trimeric autotransporter adhesin